MPEIGSEQGVTEEVIMKLVDTFAGSYAESFYPRGWDISKIDSICSIPPGQVFDRQTHWNEKFVISECGEVADFNVKMGHEIAVQLKMGRDIGYEIALILSAGPMGMYYWAAYFLNEWDVDCSHVHGFNMDEWSDKDGNTMPADVKGSFSDGMSSVFYDRLRKGVPEAQRNFATKENLPKYPDKINAIKSGGGKLITIYGIGRACHIAFWEPHFAADYDSIDEWKKAEYRLGAQLHPLTLEQNSLISFKSILTNMTACANTIGPGIFLASDYVIGGVDGIVGRGMNWQGMTLWMTLRYGPDPWVPSSMMPCLPGRFFFVKELAGPFTSEVN
jgi:glucosamine-6-phosphate deaminase